VTTSPPPRGAIGYLQLPTTDVAASIAFYEAVLGWRGEATHASFEAPGLIGQWTTDLAASGEGGPVLWFTVDDLYRTLGRVVEHGGRVRDRPVLDQGERWLVEAETAAGRAAHAGGALVLTGPGIHRAFPHEPAVAERVFHCDSRRDEFARIPAGTQCDVAIVGGGESALSATMFLRGMRPDCRYTIYTPMLPMSRGESFLENRVFSNPDTVEWESLDQQTRRDFVKHSDRGVFDPPSLAAIAYDERCHFVTGRVIDVGAADGGAGVRLEFEAPEGAGSREHDFVANCTGFDLLAQLRTLFPASARERIERSCGPIWDQPAGSEVPIGRNLELKGMRPWIHIPGLAGLSQGPGFANLGALGLLSNRVLQPLMVANTELLDSYKPVA